MSSNCSGAVDANLGFTAVENAKRKIGSITKAAANHLYRCLEMVGNGNDGQTASKVIAAPSNFNCYHKLEHSSCSSSFTFSKSSSRCI